MLAETQTDVSHRHSQPVTILALDERDQPIRHYPQPPLRVAALLGPAEDEEKLRQRTIRLNSHGRWDRRLRRALRHHVRAIVVLHIQ
jgi:hypothetical protein